MSSAPRYVVGLDLSLTASGVAVHGLENGLTEFAVVKSSGTKGATLEQTLDRVQRLIAEIAGHMPEHQALVVIEAPSLGSQNGMAHERAGLWWRVAGLLHSRGHVVVRSYPATRAKYAAGHLPVKNTRKGPDKREIVAAALGEFPHHPALKNDNVADAFALARMGARRLGSPIDSSTPQRVQAVAAVRWPETIQEGMNK